MPQARPVSALRQFRALFSSGTTTGLSDAQLLQRYRDRRVEAAGTQAEAEAAFAVLVERHGPMVWGVCRRILGDAHEAEDAFQATFLILARRAGAVRVDGSLGRWLYGVARRVAVRARTEGLRRRRHERRVSVVEPKRNDSDVERDEWLAVVDDEIACLPDRFRLPLILCHLEELSYEEAAGC